MIDRDSEILLNGLNHQRRTAKGVRRIDFPLAVARNVDPKVSRNAENASPVCIRVEAYQHHDVAALTAGAAKVG